MSLDGSFSEGEPTDPQIPPRSEFGENGPEIIIDKAGEEFLATVHSELIQQVLNFQGNDTELNAFAVRVLDGAQDKDSPDEHGKTLDDYVTGAAEALSQVVVEMMRPEKADADEEIHGFVMLLLKKSDNERTALFNGMVDRTRMSFGYEDDEEISGKIAEFIAVPEDGGVRNPYEVASRIAETYFAMVAGKLAAAWEYIEATDNKNEWEKLMGAVEEIKEQNKRETPQQRIGRQALEVVKIVAGTALGVVTGLALDRLLRRKK